MGELKKKKKMENVKSNINMNTKFTAVSAIMKQRGKKRHSQRGSMVKWTQGLNGNEQDEGGVGGRDERHICPLLFRV